MSHYDSVFVDVVSEAALLSRFDYYHGAVEPPGGHMHVFFSHMLCDDNVGFHIANVTLHIAKVE